MTQSSGASPLSVVLDYQVAADRFTGAATVGLKLDLPAARNGFGPALSLGYGSARRQGAFGRGWTLSGLPVVGIDTEDGVPAYDGRDGYSSSTAGALVRRRTPGGAPVRRDEGGFLVEEFRAREDAGRLRFERWTERATGDVHWRSRDTANALTIYGRRAASRIANPVNPAEIYQWLPDITVDARGDALAYDYLAEDARGVGSRLADAGRPTGAQRYPKRLRWGNAGPVADADAADPDALDWAFTAVFDYGDHDPDDPEVAPDRDWPVRADPFSTGTAGFEIRTWRLCRRLLTFHRFADLGPNPVLTRAIDFGYDERGDGTRLTSVTKTGFRGTGAARISQALPAVTFGYTEAMLADTFAAVPAELQAAAPDGANAARGRMLVDLHGEGLPGILHEDRAGWFFQRNLGGGRFARPRCVQARPAHALAAVSVGDFDGDGNMDAVVLSGQGAGHYRFDRATGTWSGFRRFRSIPSFGPAGRQEHLDLTGDGRADLVARTQDGLRLHESRGVEGFAPDPVHVRLADASAAGPRGAPPLSTDSTNSFLFADMTGDGLPDQVLIRDGCVAYWPNLGRGRFGRPVVMENAPRLAASGRLALERVLLADLDGSGTSDLIHLGEGEISIYTNEAGNGFGDARVLRGLPLIDTSSVMSIRDVAGDGRMALVWAERRAGRIASYQSLALSGPTPPGLVETVENGLGRRERLHYGYSAAHYLRDAGTDRAWSTSLPRHLVVVDRVETSDLIGGMATETRLLYRNGAFDSRQRRFAGFGEVDLIDSSFAEDDVEPLPAVEPSLNRTFFDQGTNTGLADRFWSGDPDAVAVPVHALDASLLTTLLDPDTALDARAALRGRKIRTEAYRVTDTGPDPVPIAVEQTGYAVRVEQAPGPPPPGRSSPLRSDRAVFAGFERETSSALYEGIANDPRVSHGFVLEHDEHGAARLAVALAYPRRAGPPLDDPAQSRLGCQVKRKDIRHDTDPSLWSLNRPVEQEEFVVTGLSAPPRGWYRFDEIAAVVAGALVAPLDHDAPPVAGRATRSNWSRTFYVAADGVSAAPLGDAAQPPRLHHTETASFSLGFATAQYGAGIAARRTELGYVESDGHWWASTETMLHHPAARFFLPAGTRLADGRSVAIDYDAPLLFPARVTDAFGAVATTGYDYAALAARRTDSPTGAWTETVFDALGRPTRASHGGTVVDQAGAERPWGFDPPSPNPPPSFAAALADPEAALGAASQLFAYDVEAFEREGAPPGQVSILAADLVHDGTGGTQSGGHASVEINYFDGYGEALLSKRRAEAGPAIHRDGTGAVVIGPGGSPGLQPAAVRWRASGRVRRNPKGEPVESFEPYFSNRPDYENDAALATYGLATRRYYDAAGRLVQMLLPDGSAERTEYGVWSERHFDANDTVGSSAWRLSREILPASDPDRRTLDATLAHDDTPVERIFDSEGRPVLLREDDGLGGARALRTLFLETGEVGRDFDARGIESGRHTYDMAGRKVAEWLADTGEVRTFFDARDNPVETVTPGGAVLEHAFDALDRLTSVTLREGGTSRVIETVAYADDPGDADSVARNLYGLAVETRDEGGRHTVRDALPTGQITRAATELVADPLAPVDWSGAVPLDGEEFETLSRHDAAGRPLEERRPDGSIVRAAYSEGGGLSRLSVATADGQVAETDVVSDVVHSIHGARERARYGNGVTVEREFDPASKLIRRIHATRSAAGGRPPLLQDIRYTYDPVGNVTASQDLAHTGAARAVFGATPGAEASRTYVHDAFYRLIRCEGRAHAALTAGPQPAGVLALSDGSGTERFTQHYTYDPSGNLTRLRHVGTAAGFTTDFWVDTASNRSRPATRPDGSPVATPTAEFGTAGELLQADHLAALVWRHDQRLQRAVVIDRSAEGRPDDDEVYLYDGGGNRLRKITRRLLGDGSVERIEVTYLGGAERRRIFRGNTLILERFVTRLNDGLGEIAELHRWTIDTSARETDDPTSAVLRYTLTDHLGSATLRLDEAARVISYEEFMPYGQMAFSAADSARETALKTHGFIGRERDAATGFHHIGQRYYASWLCRWISPDPGGEVDGPNLYLYAQANPVTNFDRTGLETTTRRRGRRIAVAARPDPPAVRTALQSQSPVVQLRYTLGQIGYYIDSGGAVHFGTPAELEPIVQRDQNAGADILVVGGRGGGTGGGGNQAEGGEGGPGGGGGGSGDPEAANPESGGDTPSPPPDPTGGTGSGQSDGTGSDPPGDQQPTPPGGGDDTGGQGGGGESDVGAEDGDPEGTGTVEGSEGTGTGGGGTSEDPNALGRGESGTGRGGGTGDPRSPGTGREDSPAHREGGTGRGTGTEPGGQPGGVPGGTGSGEGTDPNTTGTVPGGAPGGTGTEPGGAEGGIPGGVPGGQPNGAADGSPEGTVPQGDGTGGNGGEGSAPPGTGGEAEAGGGSEAGGRGSNGGNRQPGQSGEAGGDGAGGQQPATVMDQVVRVAGWWHLEFGSDRPGESGGIPGGMGSLNLGAWGQAAFVALTVVDIALTVASFGSLAAIKTGLKTALKAGARALASAGRRMMAALSVKNLRRLATRSIATANIWADNVFKWLLPDFMAHGRIYQWAMSKGGWRARLADSFVGRWFLYGVTNGALATPTTGGKFFGFWPYRWTHISNPATALATKVDNFFHEGTHALSNLLGWPLRSLHHRTVAGQPVFAVFNFMEETVAYTAGRLGSLRLHALPMVPAHALSSTYTFFHSVGGQAMARRAMAWAVGGGAAIGGGAYGAYRYFTGDSDDGPDPEAAAP